MKGVLKLLQITAFSALAADLDMGILGMFSTILAALQAGHGSCSVTLCTTGWFGCVSLMGAEQCYLNLLQFSVSLTVISYTWVSVQRLTRSLTLCAIQPVTGIHQPLWWYAQEWKQQKPFFKPSLLWVTTSAPKTREGITDSNSSLVYSRLNWDLSLREIPRLKKNIGLLNCVSADRFILQGFSSVRSC